MDDNEQHDTNTMRITVTTATATTAGAGTDAAAPGSSSNSSNSSSISIGASSLLHAVDSPLLPLSMLSINDDATDACLSVPPGVPPPLPLPLSAPAAPISAPLLCLPSLASTVVRVVAAGLLPPVTPLGCADAPPAAYRTAAAAAAASSSSCSLPRVSHRFEQASRCFVCSVFVGSAMEAATSTSSRVQQGKAKAARVSTAQHSEGASGEQKGGKQRVHHCRRCLRSVCDECAPARRFLGTDQAAGGASLAAAATSNDLELVCGPCELFLEQAEIASIFHARTLPGRSASRRKSAPITVPFFPPAGRVDGRVWRIRARFPSKTDLALCDALLELDCADHTITVTKLNVKEGRFMESNTDTKTIHMQQILRLGPDPKSSAHVLLLVYPSLVFELDLAHTGRVQDLIFAIQDQINLVLLGPSSPLSLTPLCFFVSSSLGHTPQSVLNASGVPKWKPMEPLAYFMDADRASIRFVSNAQAKVTVLLEFIVRVKDEGECDLLLFIADPDASRCPLVNRVDEDVFAHVRFTFVNSSLRRQFKLRLQQLCYVQPVGPMHVSTANTMPMLDPFIAQFTVSDVVRSQPRADATSASSAASSFSASYAAVDTAVAADRCSINVQTGQLLFHRASMGAETQPAFRAAFTQHSSGEHCLDLHSWKLMRVELSTPAATSRVKDLPLHVIMEAQASLMPAAPMLLKALRNCEASSCSVRIVLSHAKVAASIRLTLPTHISAKLLKNALHCAARQVAFDRAVRILRQPAIVSSSISSSSASRSTSTGLHRSCSSISGLQIFLMSWSVDHKALAASNLRTHQFEAEMDFDGGHKIYCLMLQDCRKDQGAWSDAFRGIMRSQVDSSGAPRYRLVGDYVGRSKSTVLMVFCIAELYDVLGTPKEHVMQPVLAGMLQGAATFVEMTACAITLQDTRIAFVNPLLVTGSPSEFRQVCKELELLAAQFDGFDRTDKPSRNALDTFDHTIFFGNVGNKIERQTISNPDLVRMMQELIGQNSNAGNELDLAALAHSNALAQPLTATSADFQFPLFGACQPSYKNLLPTYPCDPGDSSLVAAAVMPCYPTRLFQCHAGQQSCAAGIIKQKPSRGSAAGTAPPSEYLRSGPTAGISSHRPVFAAVRVILRQTYCGPAAAESQLWPRWAPDPVLPPEQKDAYQALLVQSTCFSLRPAWATSASRPLRPWDLAPMTTSDASTAGRFPPLPLCLSSRGPWLRPPPDAMSLPLSWHLHHTHPMPLAARLTALTLEPAANVFRPPLQIQLLTGYSMESADDEDEGAAGGGGRRATHSIAAPPIRSHTQSRAEAILLQTPNQRARNGCPCNTCNGLYRLRLSSPADVPCTHCPASALLPPPSMVVLFGDPLMLYRHLGWRQRWAELRATQRQFLLYDTKDDLRSCESIPIDIETEVKCLSDTDFSIKAKGQTWKFRIHPPLPQDFSVRLSAKEWTHALVKASESAVPESEELMPVEPRRRGTRSLSLRNLQSNSAAASNGMLLPPERGGLQRSPAHSPARHSSALHRANSSTDGFSATLASVAASSGSRADSPVDSSPSLPTAATAIHRLFRPHDPSLVKDAAAWFPFSREELQLHFKQRGFTEDIPRTPQALAWTEHALFDIVLHNVTLVWRNQLRKDELSSFQLLCSGADFLREPVLSARSDRSPVNLWSSLSEGVLPTIAVPQIRLSPWTCDLWFLYSRHIQVAVYECQADSNSDVCHGAVPLAQVCKNLFTEYSDIRPDRQVIPAWERGKPWQTRAIAGVEKDRQNGSGMMADAAAATVQNGNTSAAAASSALLGPTSSSAVVSPSPPPSPSSSASASASASASSAPFSLWSPRGHILPGDHAPAAMEIPLLRQGQHVGMLYCEITLRYADYE